MATYRPLKVKEATYKKIILVKGTLEQTNQRNVSIGDTIDAIFLAACEELATRSGKKLPQEFYLGGASESLLQARVADPHQSPQAAAGRRTPAP